MSALDDEKKALRRRLLDQRRALGVVAIEAASEAVARRALELPELQAARTVALYRALGNEIRMAPLWLGLRREGKRLLFPRIQTDCRVLAFGQVEELEELEPGALGVLQPPPHCDVDLGGIDLFIVPALSFDPQGGRLGRGGGYYDATLAAHPAALRIGVCYDAALVERVPAESHDEAVDLVITEARVLRAPAGENGVRHRR